MISIKKPFLVLLKPLLNNDKEMGRSSLAFYLPIILGGTLSLSAISSAEVIEQITPDFSEKSLSLPNTTSKAIIWAETKGNSSSPVFVRIDGPVGSVITLDAAKKVGVVTPQSLSSSSGWYKLPIGRSIQPTGANSLPIQNIRQLSLNSTKYGSDFLQQHHDKKSDGDIVTKTLRQSFGIGTDLCTALSPSDIKTIGETLFGNSWTRDKVCSWLRDQVAGSPGFNEEGIPVPGSGGSNGSGIVENLPDSVASAPINPNDPFFSNKNYGSLNVRALLNKDACSSTSDKYLVRITIDFSSVNRAVLGSSITIKSRLFTDEYNGRTSASIKPESEGKFFPKPLILMSSLGWNESISVKQWNNVAPIGRGAIPVNGRDRVFWQGLVLARAPIDNLLRGRSSIARNFATSKQQQQRRRRPSNNNNKKPTSSNSSGKIKPGKRATFELYTPDKAYGVCLSVKRSRQRVNGYPG
jgi:hypothetical protein